MRPLPLALLLLAACGRDPYEASLTAARDAHAKAKSTDASADWQEVVKHAEAAKAASPSGSAEAEELSKTAQQHRDWSLARETEMKGDIAGALAHAESAIAAKAPAPDPLVRYRATLQTKIDLERRRVRKADYDRVAAAARAENDPAKALALWRRAEEAADDPRDVSEARRMVQGMTALVAQGEEGARRQKAYDEALASAKAAEAAEQWDAARAQYLRALEAKPGDPAAAAALAALEKKGRKTLVLDLDGATMEFVLVRAGAFTMGDAAGDEEEKPHDVTLTKDFWMGVTEVTQAQWQAVAGSNPSSVKGAELPVTNVSWDDVQEFLKKLAPRVKDRAPGLPTEAEWEYACRAGTKTQWSCGDTDAQIDASAWTNRTSGGTPQPAGRKAPNAWGLHDMSGNVWEWCADWYGPYEAKGTDPTGPSTGTDRVVRGGSWDSKPSLARSAARYWGAPDERSGTIGLRVVLR